MLTKEDCKVIQTPPTDNIKKKSIKNKNENNTNFSNSISTNSSDVWEVVIYNNNEIFKIILHNYFPSQCDCGVFPLIRYSVTKRKFYQGCRLYINDTKACKLNSWMPNRTNFY